MRNDRARWIPFQGPSCAFRLGRDDEFLRPHFRSVRSAGVSAVPRYSRRLWRISLHGSSLSYCQRNSSHK